MRWSWAFVAMGTVLFPGWALAGEARLFVREGAGRDGTAVQSLGVVRARTVGFNPKALPGADAASPLPRAGHTIVLNLFDDVTLRARMVRAERLDKGMNWIGKIEGQPLGDVVLTVYGGILTGSVIGPDAAYGIRFDGTSHVVEQIDHNQFPDGGCYQEVPVGALDTTGGAEALDSPGTAEDSGSTIDVLVVYTAAARTAAGGPTGMESLINSAIAQTNTAYGNSGVVQRLRLVGTAEVAFTETPTDISGDLNKLTNTGDGVIDNVHALRNTYQADLVSLLAEGYAGASGICGVAWVGANSAWYAPYAFSVNDRYCAFGQASFGHELGHNMGLNHDRATEGCPTGACGSGAYSYSFGYRDPGNAFRTVMAYNCPGGCPRILRFSNPNPLYNYNGKPTGISEAAPNSANAALSLNNTRVTVANWRNSNPAQTAPQLTVTSPNGGESWASGSAHSITWTSANLTSTSSLKVSYTDGTTSYLVATLAPAQTSHSWTVPATAGSAWKVTVCSDVGGAFETCEASDSSNASFTITSGSPQVTVTAPNGGESWVAGSARTISWTSSGLAASATIRLTYTNGVTTNAIVSGLARTATSYGWTVPDNPGTAWKVTVCSEVGGFCEASDSSNATFAITGSGPGPGACVQVSRFRLYSDVTKEHHYTTDSNEYAVLGTRGWIQEGVAHKVCTSAAPVSGLMPVPLYRVYHDGIKQHLWTTDANEYSVLGSRGWIQEGVDGYILPSAASGLSVPLYRLAYTFLPIHLWTTDLNEYDVLAGRGWIQEGVVGHVLP